jgi:DNA-binding response OmpR family regulator
MMKPRSLIVAGDAPTRATLARWLMAAGYGVELAETLLRAREVVANERVALAIVVPDRLGAAGTDLARELGGQVEQVIVIEEPAAEVGTHSSGLLNEPDVLARVQSALGAAPAGQALPQLIRFEGYTLDAGAHTCVDASGQEVKLTRAEFSLLLAFVRQPGRVLSRDELTHVVAGCGAEPDDRSVDVLMSRLRRKIEPDPKTPRIIVTVPGAGYKLTAKPQAADPSPTTAAPSSVPISAAGEETKALPPSYRQRPIVGLRMAAIGAVVLFMAGLGWATWTNRADLRQLAEVMPRPTSTEASSRPRPDAAEEERRETVFNRMVAAMQDDRFSWRTVERLAIDSGVTEAQAHEILAEHPEKVMLGKSRDGKLIARLPDR